MDSPWLPRLSLSGLSPPELCCSRKDPIPGGGGALVTLKVTHFTGHPFEQSPRPLQASCRILFDQTPSGQTVTPLSSLQYLMSWPEGL